MKTPLKTPVRLCLFASTILWPVDIGRWCILRPCNMRLCPSKSIPLPTLISDIFNSKIWWVKKENAMAFSCKRRIVSKGLQTTIVLLRATIDCTPEPWRVGIVRGRKCTRDFRASLIKIGQWSKHRTSLSDPRNRA